jgi:hypothetical protein
VGSPLAAPPRPQAHQPARTARIVRILVVIADRIGRAPTIGRPWLWRLKIHDAEQSSAPPD